MKAVISAKTVGDIRAAARELGEPFLVINGDGICEIELGKLLEFHLSRNADITVVCSKTDNPQSHAAVEVDEFDKAKTFTEETPFSNMKTDCFDTGIYVINPELLGLYEIKDAISFPYGFFKELLNKEKRIFAFRCDGIKSKKAKDDKNSCFDKVPSLNDSDCFAGLFGESFDAVDAALIGQSLASMRIGRKTGIVTDSSVLSKSVAECISGTMAAQGSRVWSFGEGFYSQLEFYMRFCSLESGLFIHSQDGRVSVMLLGENGLPPSNASLTELENRIRNRDFNYSSFDELREPSDMSGVAMMYRREILRQTETELSELSCTVKCPNRKITALLEDCLYQLGCRTGGEISFKINNYGTLLSAFSRECGWVAHDRLSAIILNYETANGRDVSVCHDQPYVFDEISQKNGRSLLRYYRTPVDFTDSVAREKSRANPFMRDALLMAVRLLGIICTTGKSLARLSGELPDFYVSRRRIPLGVSPAELKSRLTGRQYDTDSEGISVNFDGGRVLLVPSRSGRSLRIFSEAASYEMSKELCGEIEKLIKPKNVPDAPN